MNCPYLEAKPVARCLAYTNGIRILRDSELEDLCHTKLYVGCLIYKQRLKENRKRSKPKVPIACCIKGN